MAVFRFTTFRLGEQLLGLDVPLVSEIAPPLEVTEVPLARDFIHGLGNLRGKIITIIDLGVRLGLGPRQVTPSTHNIILRTEENLSRVRRRLGREDLVGSEDLVGLLVDAIGDEAVVDDSDVEPPPPNVEGIGREFVSCVAKLPEELLFVLDVRALLDVGS